MGQQGDPKEEDRQYFGSKTVDRALSWRVREGPEVWAQTTETSHSGATGVLKPRFVSYARRCQLANAPPKRVESVRVTDE